MPGWPDGLEDLASLPLPPGGAPPAPPARPDDLATLIYTSGTTGEPKGVMLSHRNIVFQIRSLRPLFPITDTDETLSFLPLSHVYARVMDYIFLFCGCQITYLAAPEKVVEYITDVRPTVMGAFPGLYEKAYVRIVSRVQQEGGLRQRLFGWALGVGRRVREAAWQGRRPPIVAAVQYPVARRLVFSKVLARFGGRLRFTVSGGAPLAREIAEFFDILGLPVLNGYGLTESAPVIAVNRLDRNRLGSVGQPAPGVEVRIADDGEILARGPNIMQGYWNRPEATREAVGADGWLHTGDIGYLDADDFLHITDRKKNLIATVGGKKVAPEPIEAQLRASPYISQAVCVGDNRPYITALVVPNVDTLERELAGRGYRGLSREQIASHPLAEALVGAAVRDVNAALAPFERVRRFTLLPADLTLDAGELTPSMKLRRRVIQERYRDLIDQMYRKTHRSADYGLDEPEAVGGRRS